MKPTPEDLQALNARRYIPSREVYQPKPIVTRPGSGDAFALPSRRGEELLPHALPMSLAGGAR